MHTNPFSREVEKIKLTARERRDLRARLTSYMEYHPLTLPLPQRRVRTASFSLARFISASVLQTRLRQFVGAAALLLVLAVPLYAERAVPGDALYLVKVRFNESVRSSFARSPYEKIEWEAARVERRITEARLLAGEGRLTDETRDELVATVREHTSAANAQLSELRESDASGAAIAAVTLESALDVQTAVLASEPDGTADGGADTRVIATALREARSEVSSTTVQQANNTPLSYERLLVLVEEDTTHISALREGLAGALNESDRAELDERTARVTASVTAAAEAHDAGEDEGALTLLREALATTQKLVAFLSDIDVREKVSLDTLVPDNLGEGEVVRHLAAVAARREILDTRLREVAAVLRTAATEDLAAFDRVFATVGEPMAAGSYVEATRRITESEAHLAAVEQLLVEAEEEAAAENERRTATTTEAGG